MDHAIKASFNGDKASIWCVRSTGILPVKKWDIPVEYPTHMHKSGQAIHQLTKKELSNILDIQLYSVKYISQLVTVLVLKALLKPLITATPILHRPTKMQKLQPIHVDNANRVVLPSLSRILPHSWQDSGATMITAKSDKAIVPVHFWNWCINLLFPCKLYNIFPKHSQVWNNPNKPGDQGWQCPHQQQTQGFFPTKWIAHTETESNFHKYLIVGQKVPASYMGSTFLEWKAGSTLQDGERWYKTVLC